VYGHSVDEYGFVYREIATATAKTTGECMVIVGIKHSDGMQMDPLAPAARGYYKDRLGEWYYNPHDGRRISAEDMKFLADTGQLLSAAEAAGVVPDQ
jgi:hypothetical protein